MKLDAHKQAERCKFPFGAAMKAIIVLLISAFVVLGIGCGGGTTGTGGSGSDDFAGKLLTLSGSPVVNATVTVAETGDSAVTDSNGEFNIQTNTPPSDKATLLVETAISQSSAVVDELPDVPAVVEVSLQLNEKANSLAVTSKKVTPKKKRPTPKPTKLPTVVPSEQPTPIVTPQPTVEVTPTPTPTPTPDDGGVAPTETPSITPTSTPTVTPTATPILFPVVFRGTVTSADQSLLMDAKIGIVGDTRRFKIQSDGKFSFKALPSSGAMLVVRSGQLFARTVLDGVTDHASRVIINAAIALNDKGHLILNITSIRVIEGTPASPETQLVGP